MITLVACDLDGTLLNSEHLLPKENVEAIKNIQKAGIRFMAATGRNLSSVVPLLKEHNVSCDCLLLNGALICDISGNAIFEQPMEKEKAIEITEILQKEDMCFHVYAKDGVVTSDSKRGRKEFRKHMLRQGMSDAEIDNFMESSCFGIYDREVSDMRSYIEGDSVIYKIEAFGNDHVILEAVRQKLFPVKGVSVTNSVANNIEVTNIKAQKGISLQTYCRENNIHENEVLVLGDSLNDLSMMENFYHSVAMANAIQKIKDTANFETAANDELGVALVLQKLIEGHPL